MPATSPILLSIAVLAAFALIGGGGRLIVRGTDRRKGVLMIVAAIVLLGNIAIAAWPSP